MAVADHVQVRYEKCAHTALIHRFRAPAQGRASCCTGVGSSALGEAERVEGAARVADLLALERGLEAQEAARLRLGTTMIAR